MNYNKNNVFLFIASILTFCLIIIDTARGADKKRQTKNDKKHSIINGIVGTYG